MKNKYGLAALTLLALACTNAQAADLQVTGSIVPGSCSLNIPTLSVDYGRVNVTDLSPVDYTKLDKLNTAFNITCDGPTLVGLTANDNRAASNKHEAMIVVNPSLVDPRLSFGMGTNADGEKIGSYSLKVSNYSVDGGTDFKTVASNGGDWFAAKDVMRSRPHYVLTWSSISGDYSPHLLTTVSGELEIEAAINNTTELVVRDDLDIDGSATLEVKYI